MTKCCTHRIKRTIRGTVKIQLWCMRSTVRKFMLLSCCSDRTGLWRIWSRQYWQNGDGKWEWAQSHVVRSTRVTPRLQNNRYGHPGSLIWCSQYDWKKCIFHLMPIENTAVTWLPLFWHVTPCILLICLWFNDAVISFGQTESNHRMQTGW